LTVLEKSSIFAGSNSNNTGEKMTVSEVEQQTQRKQQSEAYQKNIEEKKTFFFIFPKTSLIFTPNVLFLTCCVSTHKNLFVKPLKI